MVVKIILGIVAFLWVFGFVQIPLLNMTLFSLFGHPVTLRSLLLIGFIGYLINFLPGILQKIAMILFVLWILSQFVFPMFGSLGQLFLIIIIIAVVFSFF
ncbi:MAG: hypothetical protein AAB553_01160 [Patescibacteria group bacterium]